MKSILKNTGIYVLLLLLVQSNRSNASENPLKSSITGKVIDASSNKPVEYANVLLYSHADSSFVGGTISDSNGVFCFEKVKTGNYYMVFKFMGYKNQTISNIELSKDVSTKIIPTIKLELTAAELNVVTINSEKTPIEFKVDKKVINVDQQINAASGTAVDVLQNSPGVTVDAEGNVFLRGSANYTVLIDGKPKPMGGADLLKQIPSSSIKNIEIITNPSAKYDAEGTIGIINIIMKKQTADGFNGLLNGGIGTWKKYTGDAQFNIKRKKLNFYVGAVARHDPFTSMEDYQQSNLNSDTTYYVHGYGPSTQTVQNYSGKGGIDYTPDAKNSVSFYAEYGRFSWQKAEDNKYFAAMSGLEIYSWDYQRVDITRDYLVSTLDYTHKFKNDNHTISVSLQYTNRKGNNKSSADEYASSPSWENFGATSLEHNAAKNAASLYQVNLDYVNAFTEKRVLEAGMQAKVRPIATRALYELFDIASQLWLYDSNYSNEYNFHNNNYAAYATYSDHLWGFDLKAGLRLEYTDRMLNQITKNKSFEFKQLDYFPSFFISRDFKNNHQLQFSYSRRINHPEEWSINPYPIFTNDYAYGTGNPYLKPEYANAFELNYLKIFKVGSLSICTYYRNTNGVIDQVWKTDENNKTIITFENMNQSRMIGAEVDVNIAPVKWFSFNVGGSFYNYNLSGMIAEMNFSNSSNNYDFRFTPTFRLHKTTRLQLNFIYNGPTVTTQGNMSSFYGLNFTVKQEFFKQRFAITLNVQDVLNSMKYSIITKTPNYISTLSGDYQSPIVQINLTYKFNNFVRKNRPQEIMDVK